MADRLVTRRLPAAAGWLSEYGVYVAIGALLLFNLIATPNFLSLTNLRTQLLQASPVVIVALGMALVIGTEGIDLSVGAVMALAAAVLPLYLGYGPVVAVGVALVVGLAAGTLNGILVARLGIAPIVATLALLVGGRGLALVIAHGRLVDIRNPAVLSLGSAAPLGIPISVLVAAVLAIGTGLLIHATTFGRQLVAIGGNRSASALSGLPVRRVLVTVYVVCGIFAALAGVLATARLRASDPADVGLLMELSAITAVVVGGTPLTGGRVRVAGTVAGALLMQLIVSTLITHDLPSSTAQMVQAAVIVVAVYVARERGGR